MALLVLLVEPAIINKSNPAKGAGERAFRRIGFLDKSRFMDESSAQVEGWKRAKSDLLVLLHEFGLDFHRVFAPIACLLFMPIIFVPALAGFQRESPVRKNQHVTDNHNNNHNNHNQ